MKELPEFAEEYTKKERIKLTTMWVIGGSIVFIIQLIFLNWFKEFYTSLASAPCREIVGIKGTAWVWYVMYLGLIFPSVLLIIFWFGYRGMKILQDKQCPPIGQKVDRPTRIRRGKEAQWMGWLNLVIMASFLGFLTWTGIDTHARAERTYAKFDCTAGKNHLK